MQSTVRVYLESDLRPELLLGLTSELASDLNRHSFFRADIPSASGERGAKGGGESIIGQLLLTIVGTAGVCHALVQCLKAYIDRDRRLSICIKRADGAELHIDAHHLTQSAAKSTFDTVEEFITEATDQINDATTNRDSDRQQQIF